MAKMTTTRQLNGDYGMVGPGAHIDVPDDIAEHYEANGLAIRGHVKLTGGKIEKVEATKAIHAAPENKAILPEAIKQPVVSAKK